MDSFLQTSCLLQGITNVVQSDPERLQDEKPIIFSQVKRNGKPQHLQITNRSSRPGRRALTDASRLSRRGGRGGCRGRGLFYAVYTALACGLKQITLIATGKGTGHDERNLFYGFAHTQQTEINPRNGKSKLGST